LIRLILAALYLVWYALMSMPMYLIANILGKKDKRKQAAFAQRFIHFGFNQFLGAAGTKVTVIGLEKIPRDRPVLFVANHRSYFDAAVMYAKIPPEILTGFVAKKELAHVPCISRWMRYTNCEFIDRSDIRAGMKTILTCIAHVKDGYCMFVAPEGTRNHNPDQKMGEFHAGSLKIAEKAGCPIVPVAINNADAVFELHQPWVRAARVALEFGDPVETASLSPEEKKHLSDLVQAKIQDMLDRNQKLCTG